MSYKTNIFINCAFDSDYYPLLKAILFTVIFCGLKPKLSETQDGDDIRIRQIQKLIIESKYSIHDISRIIPKSKKDLPRFNMPFELGMDLGCKMYSKSDKKCLILEENQYRYKVVLSDISGQDISSHENDPLQIIKCVRNWIYKIKSSTSSKPAAYTVIWDLYNEFLYDFDKDMKAENLDPNKMWEIPFTELIDLMSKWIRTKTIKKRKTKNS